MTDVSKLCPISIALLSNSHKGGDIEVKEGDTMWVIKNVSGNYHGPYQVTAKCDMVRDGHSMYGFLALIETPVDDYYTTITTTDIIGKTKEDVLAIADAIIVKQDENSSDMSRLLKNFTL